MPIAESTNGAPELQTCSDGVAGGVIDRRRGAAPNPGPVSRTSLALTRWTGLAAVFVLWSTQGLGSARAHFDLLGERPLSYLAHRPAAGELFSGGLVVAAVLFVCFHGYVRTRYPVGTLFSVAMLVAMAGQFVAGVVPIGGTGVAGRLHVTSALVLGALIPVLMWRFAACQPLGPWRRRCYGLFWLEGVACVAGVALSQRHVAPLAEILPAMGFHAWVVAVTLHHVRT